MLAIANIQEHILRMVYEDQDSLYEDLFSKNHMPIQECQTIRTWAIEVYKAVNNITPSYI